MSDENEDIAMAECGSCRSIVPADSSECPECGISFSGVSDEALGECGACNALVPLDSTKCPECGVVFVADDVIDILRTWMANNKMDVKTLFGRFDTNDDNMIDSGELKDGLLSLNLADLPPSQVDKLVQAIDDDGDSLIDLEELQTIIGGEELASSDIDETGSSESEDDSEPIQDVDDSEPDEEPEQEPEEEEVEELDEDAEETADELAEEMEEDIEEPATEIEEEIESEEEDVDEEQHESEEDEDVEDEISYDDYTESEATDDRSTSEILELLLDVIEEEDKSLANAFGDLDDDGNRLLTAEELVSKLNQILPDGLSQTEADALLETMDADGDGNIDMVEFVNAIEKHEDSIATLDDEDAETVKTFPSEWQTRFMSKKWHDTFWPLIHASFGILIVGLLVNGLFPIVDGTGGMVELEIRGDSQLTEWQLDDGRIVAEGEAYPCDPQIQEGECKNSLTPLAGKASSMPGKFYWDAVVLMTLAGAGLVWSLYTHLILAPGWRARVKAMKDVDADRNEVQEAIEESEDEETDETEDETDGDAEIEAEDEVKSEDYDDSDEEDDEEESAPDIGDYVGLDIDGEEYYGTILEFDDDEDTVVIEDEETGDEIVGYQDEMFIPEE
jgi:Ca2+-binding EF-hand superfamily protein/RNA polymerase subunit RPABC4/transcription elongation factor Spt4